MSESEDPVMVVVNEQSVHLSDMIRSLSVEGNWKLFERFARRQVIIQWADREGIELSPEDLQNEVDEWRYKNRLERVEDTDAWLDQYGVTLFDVVVEAEFRLYERWLISRIKEDNIRVFFVQRTLDFERVEVCWISVSDEGMAEELCLQVKEEGADFYSLARRYSQDEATRSAGGYLGRRRRRDLPQGVAPLIFAASEGDVVGPVKVEKGYALYYVQKRCPAVLDETTREKIRKKLFGSYLQREMKRAEITFPFNVRRLTLE